MCLPAETNRVVQVKYTNPHDREIVQKVLYPPRGADRHRQRGFQDEEREICMTFGSEEGHIACQLVCRD